MQYFFDYSQTGNNINDWKNIFQKIQQNIKDVSPKAWIDWPEKDLYTADMEWKIIPICYCVPSDNLNNQIWIDTTSNIIPDIYRFIKSLKNVRTALISRMGKNVKLKYHQGWECVANHVLRCHLPIIVDDNKSGIVVRDVCNFHKEQDYILFDDSLEHYGFNKSENTRYVLIIDFKRPENVQTGISKIEASDALLKLCAFYKTIDKIYKEL